MAHFAKLDENNNVIEVAVVANEALDPNNEEASGIAFLTEWSGGHNNWKQTSYNKNFRFNFASTEGTYDPELDAFLYKKPFSNWILDTETCTWIPPFPHPDDGNDYQWFEEEGRWIQTNE